MRRVILVGIIIVIALASVGCGGGVPSINEAKWQIYSEQAYYGQYIYADNYTIDHNGVLHLDDYYAYVGGCICDPIYEYFDEGLALTSFSVSIRKEAQ